MKDKSPNKSMLTRLNSIIKEIEDDSRPGGKNFLTPTSLAILGRTSRLLTKALGRKGKLAKGGIVKKSRGGSVTKKTKKKK
tara:strand:- start:895 stop:1137 length:243 start_codon:yes stop_codon:yes gene_type:complete